MNIVAKTDHGFLVSLTYEELGKIMTGKDYSDNSAKLLKTGQEIDINERFGRIMKIASTNTTNKYDSIRYRLEALLENFQPVLDTIETIKTEIDGEKATDT